MADSRVGQTLVTRINGRDVVAQCSEDDGRRVSWISACGGHAGEWDARLWDLNRRRQAEGGGDE